MDISPLITALNAREGWWAEAADSDEPDYLIRFGKDGDDPMLLMADYGMTWEPATNYSTPRWCTIDSSNPEVAADKLVRVAQAAYAGEIEWGSEGDGAGDTI